MATKAQLEEAFDRFKTLTEKNAYHIDVLNHEHGETRDLVKELFIKVESVGTCTTQLITDMKWLKKFLWIIGSASIGSFIAILIQQIFRVSSTFRGY